MSEDRATGFAAMPAYIARDGTIDTSTKALLLVLSSFAGADQSCWPTNKTLAAATGLHEATVRRLLRAAESRGLITTTERTDANGAMLANKYRLNFGKWGGIGNDSEPRTKRTGEGRADAREGGAPTLGGGAHPRAPNKTIQQDLLQQDVVPAEQRERKSSKKRPSTRPPKNHQPSEQECEAFFLTLVGKRFPTDGIAAREAGKFFDRNSAHGWRTKTGPIVDWKAAARLWAKNWFEWNPEQAGARAKPAYTVQPGQRSDPYR